MARTIGLKRRCLPGCGGWPELYRTSAGHVVVTCWCGARRWRPETLLRRVKHMFRHVP